jgi:O-antigen ligase
MDFQKNSIASKPWPFWIMCAFLILAFMTGGSSRADVQSLVILRPVAVLVCFFALWRMKKEMITDNKFLLSVACACVLLAGLHIMPLPPSIWQSLPGRELISEIDNQAGLGQIWRPMSLDPVAGWNALYSLSVPIAVLLLGITLKRDEIYGLFPLIICIGVATGLVGLIQAASGTETAANLYRISNKGAAVGLFANRNHQAVFLATMFPMLAAYACTGIKSAEQAKFRLILSIAAGLVLIPLLLVTGSRAGIITGLLGLLSVIFIYRTPKVIVSAKRKVAKKRLSYIAVTFAIVTVSLLSILFSRATAIDRLFSDNINEDARAKIFAPAIEKAWNYFPFGSGMGSFATTFKIDEPAATISPEFINRAHNDYLELYLTGGLPALILLSIMICAVLVSAWKLWKTRKELGKPLIYGRASIIICFIFMVASTSDYPLRMPSLMCFSVIIALWLKRANAIENKKAIS